MGIATTGFLALRTVRPIRMFPDQDALASSGTRPQTRARPSWHVLPPIAWVFGESLQVHSRRGGLLKEQQQRHFAVFRLEQRKPQKLTETLELSASPSVSASSANRRTRRVLVACLLVGSSSRAGQSRMARIACFIPWRAQRAGLRISAELSLSAEEPKSNRTQTLSALFAAMTFMFFFRRRGSPKVST